MKVAQEGYGALLAGMELHLHQTVSSGSACDIPTVYAYSRRQRLEGSDLQTSREFVCR
jgi:hypothetical protein